MNDPLPHYVDGAPFDVYEGDRLTPEQERYYMAPHWRMMWWKFRRHRVAVIAGFALLFSYASILITEFLAPYALATRHIEHIYAPPQRIRFFHEGALIGPFVYPLQYQLDLETLRREYTADRSRPQSIRFFCQGDPYKFWGLIPGRLHLVCPPRDGTLFLLGTDRLGRDMASRRLYGGRVSLTVGLIGIAVSFVLCRVRTCISQAHS